MKKPLLLFGVSVPTSSHILFGISMTVNPNGLYHGIGLVVSHFKYQLFESDTHLLKIGRKSMGRNLYRQSLIVCRLLSEIVLSLGLFVFLRWTSFVWYVPSLTLRVSLTHRYGSLLILVWSVFFYCYGTRCISSSTCKSPFLLRKSLTFTQRL